MMKIETCRVVLAVAELAAWCVSRVRPVVQLELSDYECEEAGLPYGSTEPAVIVGQPARGLPWWRVSAWLDGANGSPEGCLHVDLLGWTAEVYYLREPTRMQTRTEAL
jgi:hypothetical protein